MLRVEIPKNKAKIRKQIEALEWAISQDTNEKDKAIHMSALSQLKKAVEE